MIEDIEILRWLIFASAYMVGFLMILVIYHMTSGKQVTVAGRPIMPYVSGLVSGNLIAMSLYCIYIGWDFVTHSLIILLNAGMLIFYFKSIRKLNKSTARLKESKIKRSIKIARREVNE